MRAAGFTWVRVFFRFAAWAGFELHDFGSPGGYVWHVRYPVFASIYRHHKAAWEQSRTDPQLFSANNRGPPPIVHALLGLGSAILARGRRPRTDSLYLRRLFQRFEALDIRFA